DQLLGDGGAAAAVLGGPAQADPARLAQLPLPLEPDVPPRLVGRSPAAAEGGVLAQQVLAQPGANLVAKGFVGGAEAEVHPAPVLLDRAVKTHVAPAWPSPQPQGGGEGRPGRGQQAGG